MSVRNIVKRYVKFDELVGTSLTVPITFTGPFTVTVDVIGCFKSFETP